MYVLDRRFALEGAPVGLSVGSDEFLPPFTVRFTGVAAADPGVPGEGDEADEDALPENETHQLMINTNLTALYVPLVIYHGRLRFVPVPSKRRPNSTMQGEEPS